MKQLFAIFVTALFCFETVPALAAKAAAETKAEARQKKVAEKEKELNGSQWKVALVPQDPKEKPSQDVLIFQDNQVQLESLAKKGYGTTNYTVSVYEGQETASWETMKKNKAIEGVAFLRGEWLKDKMQGVVTENIGQDEKMKVKKYQFTTSDRKAIPPTAPQEKEKGAVATSSGTPALIAQETPSAAKSKKSPEKGGVLVSL